LDESLPRLANIHVGASEEDGELVFLHKVFNGATDKSYGIHVAKLAGMPVELLQNAQVVLKELEANNLNEVNKDQQLSLFDLVHEETPVQPVDNRPVEAGSQAVIDQLKDEDIYNLTPIQALNFLAELKSQL
ncbi:MutS-related protein, partial [Aerococcus sp. L_4]